MEIFDPACLPEYVYSALNLKPPPAPRSIHPLADPKGTFRKELTRCQQCFKSRGPGVNLKTCSACKSDMYCSKECQTSAWKTRKVTCALNQLAYTIPLVDEMQELRVFVTKHQPTIASAGVHALDVMADPSRAEQDLLLICLRSRPDSRRSETAFFVTAAAAVPIDTFPKQQVMREQLKLASDETKRHPGMAGALLVYLFDFASGATNLCPVGFPQASPTPPNNPAIALPHWKEYLTANLNEGIIL
ncbi:hypothetical protein B0H17DRAFT_698543 [Mycena rosella]|uniref:MYND-type domain-containing protein n=1 Tax=Mycena rosella TaxID=1033263 RepID=A0AAD7GTX6_MYCRO|nr:hypothetical protein B0H17DRAFT_698543 [Mycena rosella]